MSLMNDGQKKESRHGPEQSGPLKLGMKTPTMGIILSLLASIIVLYRG